MNRPDRRSIVRLGAGLLAGCAAARIEALRRTRTGPEQHPDLAPVLPGIDVLERDGFALLRGCRVGLITNQTGLNRAGLSTASLLMRADGVRLVALFSPEHGLTGRQDREGIPDATDDETGLPVYSLYGERRAPTAEQFSGIDTLVYDIQDIGCRFYTYISTLERCLRSAAENRIAMVVLDRPNPINGVDVEGPVLDAGRESFTGCHTIPVRHGMTAGEIARMVNVERGIRADLAVVPVEGWQRGDWFDAAGLRWVNPSPNMRRLTAANLYPGIGLLESTNLSVGRGTDTPFEIIGAPWMDSMAVSRTLGAAGLGGVAFVPADFVPESSRFAGETCHGMQIIVTDRSRFRPVRTGIAVALALRSIHSSDWDVKRVDQLLCHAETIAAIRREEPLEAIEAGWQSGLTGFLARREEFLLYGE